MLSLIKKIFLFFNNFSLWEKERLEIKLSIYVDEMTINYLKRFPVCVRLEIKEKERKLLLEFFFIRINSKSIEYNINSFIVFHVG
jgi:hypothetical protein